MIKLLHQAFKKIPKHSILLIGIFLFAFVFPNFERGISVHILIAISYSIILLSIGSIVESRSKWFYYIILLSVIFQWATYIFSSAKYYLIGYFSFAFSLSVFIIASYMMVRQIIKTKDVNSQLIIESITGYLLIGVIFTLINTFLLSINPEAISFVNKDITLGSIVYYSYVTVTTIGYGDILPSTQMARTLAILFGLIGQLYLTIIIAFILGKFLNSNKH